MCSWSTVTKKSEERKSRETMTGAKNATNMQTAREHGNQVPMRNVHARHKLYTYTMRVKEVVKLTAPTCIAWLTEEEIQGKH